MAKSENLDTNEKLVKAFKEVLMRKDFKDIRIKDITDKAGLFRATFYTYFPDKYAMFDEILHTELFSVVESLAKTNMLKQSIEFILNYFLSNRDFYRRVFEYTGPESCHEALKKSLKSYFTEVIKNINPQIKPEYASSIRKGDFSQFSSELFYVAIINVCESDLSEADIIAQADNFILFFRAGVQPFLE